MNPTHRSTARPMLRNFVTTALLGMLVFWLGFESSERGVFKFKRDSSVQALPTEGQAVEAQATLQAAGSAAPMATPTPLPAHFPTIPDSNLPDQKAVHLSLIEAFSACWPQVSVPLHPSDDKITPLEAESLFGKIKKREILSKSAGALQLGVLFDKSVFPAGAAGSATESEGRWTELRFRAAGRMLHCEKPGRCECI